MALVHMYDSIQSNIPSNAEAVAGYVGGRWPTWYAFLREFPHLAAKGRVVSIAINAAENARFLDVETGDARPDQAPGWFHAHAVHTQGTPGFYCSASIASQVIGACTRAGIPRSSYLLWSAHYSHEHICGPATCGYPAANGTQYADNTLGRNLDESLLDEHWFVAPAPPKPPTPPKPKPQPPYPIDWFPSGQIAVPPQWQKHPDLMKLTSGSCHSIDERAIVQRYRDLEGDPKKNAAELKALKQALIYLRQRVWAYAHSELVQCKPSWGVHFRGWRWQELANMTEGVKQEW